MPSSPITLVLWILGVTLPLAAAIVMWRRGLNNEYPTFFTFTLFQSVGGIFLFAVARFSSPEAYYFGYWVNTALGAGLGFFVIREAFNHMLKPYVGLRDAGMLLFRFAAVLLVLFAAVSYVGGVGSGFARIAREITIMQRNIMLIWCGLLLFIVMCSNYLNISWKTLPCGISFGMGMFAAMDLISSNILASRGFVFSKPTLTLLMQIAWAAAAGLWIGYAALAVPKRAMERKLTYNPVVDRWNQAAMLIMNSEAAPPAEHTYLSDIERTVESVLAHSK